MSFQDSTKYLQFSTMIRQVLSAKTILRAGILILAVYYFAEDTKAPSPQHHRIPIDLNPYGSDPLGILEVSSFYGPGVWAAWFLTLNCATSGRSNIYIALSVLYPAVAGLDLLIRYYQISRRGDGLAFERELGGLAAAYTIVWSSVMYAIVFLTDTRLELVVGVKGELLKLVKRWRLVVAGFLPIFLALFLFSSAMRVQTLGGQDIVSRKIFTKVTLQKLPVLLLVRDGSRDFRLSPEPLFTIDWACLGFGLPGWFILQLVFESFVVDAKPKSALGAACWAAPFFAGVAYMLLWLGIIGHIMHILGFWVAYFIYFIHDRCLPTTSVLIPYTHHSFLDLDQMIALLLGAAAFVLEMYQEAS